jgi:putative membrane protein
MKHTTLVTTIATALLTFTVTPALFAADDVKTERSTATQATADAQFMDHVIRGGLMQIQAAEIAESKTKRENVKDFAKAIQRDHADVNKNLKTLADRMTMKLPKDIGDHQAFIDGLKAKTDADFDRTYVAATVLSHQKCVEMFEKFSGTTKNADLKAFADNTLPGLRMHLKNGQSLLGTLGGASGTASK